MLWKTTAVLVFSLFIVVSAQGEGGGGDLDVIEMSNDRMMGDEDRCVESMEGLTTCTVKRGSSVGFSGSLLILGSKVLDLKANLKWNTLGVTSFSNQQVCQINGRVYIGTAKCKSGNGDPVHRIGLHSAGPRPDSAFFFQLPDSGSLETDTVELTGTVTWDNSSKSNPVEDYLIDRMIVKFSDN